MTPATHPQRRKLARPEQAFQASLVRDLTRILTDETFVFAVPNGGMRSGAEAAILIGQGVKPGVPDLILISRGQAFGLELKATKGRVRDSQAWTHDRMRIAGARVAVVRTLDETIKQLRSWSIPLRIKDEERRAAA